MTETSPVCTIGHPPKDMGDEDEVDWRVYGPGASCPASSCGSPTTPAPRCRGTASRSARSRCAGPWITAAYYRVDDPEKFHDGWLRTGDVASVYPERLRA